jgi:aerobic C4-dicarboxylate transport protein
LFIAWWDRTLDADRARRVFNGENVAPMPAEDPILLDEVADIDEDLTGYGHHAPKEISGTHVGPPSDAGPATPAGRRPAYSETN